MKLEEEIKQNKFASEHEKALLNVIVSSNWINGLTANVLKPFGISPQQYNVLRILRGQYPKPVTLGLIQERMLDKMSNASRLVDKLVEKNFVARNQCCHNRRQVDILITREGIDMLTMTDQSITVSHDLLKKITEPEAMELNRILEKLRA
jgi:DNA-binding MarR family transcriptional regulator